MVIRVLGIGLSLIGLFWSLYETKFLMTPIVFSLLSAGQLMALIYYVENSTRELNRFFQSFTDRDYTKSFDSEYKGKAFTEISNTFNQMIDAFKKLNIEKEEYYQYLKQVNEHVEVSLISFKANGKVDLMNKAAQRLLKKPLLYSIDAVANTYPELYTAFISMKSGEKRLQKTEIDGEVFSLALVAKKFKLSGVDYTLIALQDIRQELQANEIDAWQKLIRVLTHEIMNSMTPVLSLTTAIGHLVTEEGKAKSAAQLSNEDVSDIHRSISAIENRGKGLLSFVNAYRDYTKIPELNLENVKLSQLVEEVKLLLDSDFKKENISLVFNAAYQDELEVQVDPKLISQVLINLLKNAKEALAGQLNGKVALSLIQNGTSTIIEISDNGPGIPPEIQDQIFIPFFTTKKLGNGIGLSLSNQIIKLHGGELSFLPSEVGSRFVVRLVGKG